MTKSYTSAMEGIFDPEATVDSLLATVKENIISKVTSVDQAADLENRLSEEAAEFNSMLATISTAMRQCEAGEITKEEAMAAAKPCVDALKERCEALKLGDVDVKDDDITENEIAMLREYIVGCKDIVAAHKESLQDCPITQNEEKSEDASEGVLSYLGNMDVANEASLAMSVRNSNDAKNATALYKNAKKLYAMGSKDKAKTYMQQAKAKYEKCLDAAKKIGKPHKVERTVGTADVSYGSSTFYKDKDKNYTAYTVPGMAYVVRYFEDRVDTCEAYLRQWANKAGNKDLQETKEMLKKERQEEKARIRASRKKAATEAALIYEQIEALESLMDGYELDLSLGAALEAEGTDGPATNASSIGSKLRSAFSKLRRASKSGDMKAAEVADREVKAAAKELEDASRSTDDEGKKKLSTAAKIGIAAASAVLLTVGLTAGGQMLAKKANSVDKKAEDIHVLSRMIIQGSDAVLKAVRKSGELGRKGFSKIGNKLDAKNMATWEKNVNSINNNKDLSDGAAQAELDKVNKRYEDNQQRIMRLHRAGQNVESAAWRASKGASGRGGSGYTWKKTKESFSELDGSDFLSMLAMEEANFDDEVPLTEIENEEGRGFDNVAQGEDLTDEAIVGVDDLDDEDEVEESVLESTLSVMMLEDGIDPDED